MRLFLMLILTVPLLANAAERICGDIDTKGVPEDLVTTESAFVMENALNALEYFENAIPEMHSKCSDPG